MFGSYQLFDAETHKQIPVATPSGLSPQTWIFRNAEPNRKYIVTASFSDPDIEYAFGVTLIKSVKMIQYFIPGTEVDRIIYKNFDTKKEIEITKEKEVASILSYLSNMKGVALDSTEGYSGGSCAIHLMDDEFEALSITFTDDTNDWVYCGYAGGDNYPTHFGLQNVTVADVMAYFSQYDTGTSSEANNISEYLTEEGNDQYLILPVSKSKVRVSDLHTQYLYDIDLNLLRTSEEKINGIISQYPKNSGFYVQYYDGYLRLCTEVIVEIDPPESTDISGGCGIDHEHKYFDEPITK